MAGVVGAVLLEWLIVTDREQIVSAIHDMKAAAERGDVQRLLDHVSTAYADEELSREELGSLARWFFETYGPVRVGIVSIRANIAGNIALTLVDLAASARAARAGARSTWELSWRKERDGTWRIRQIVLRKFDDRTVTGWDFVLKHVAR